jgi:hypothetical protein
MMHGHLNVKCLVEFGLSTSEDEKVCECHYYARYEGKLFLWKSVTLSGYTVSCEIYAHILKSPSAELYSVGLYLPKCRWLYSQLYD